ncbi:MAG: type II secretion system F family protein [Candidatus Omnitrophica bacterium]|nr:type II secretion system F family protein [Candidatus Omnitrophota bacterium]
MRLLIILLIFGSIGGLAYELIPLLLGRYSQLQSKRMEKASKELHQMFIYTEKHRLLPMFTITPLALGALGFIISHNLLGVLVGAGLGLLLPRIWIKNVGRKRQNDFARQLVDALMLLSSSLRAGMSLPQAFEVLTEEMPAPISDEFALVIKENKMGVTLEDCLAHLKQRIPLDDLELLTTAISISRETGGDLTEIFANLVQTIREKRKLDDRVKVLTVQGRLQGAIMGLLPIAFAIFIYFINPHNFDIMFSDKTGQMLLVWAVVSEVIGVILIRKLSRVEI